MGVEKLYLHLDGWQSPGMITAIPISARRVKRQEAGKV